MINLYSKFLDNLNQEIVEEIIMIIGNIINDNEESKQIIIKSNILNKIFEIAEKGISNHENIQEILWILSSFFKRQKCHNVYIPIPEEIVFII